MEKKRNIATFGWVAIDSATMNSLRNTYQNIANFRRDLYGKEISRRTIEKVAAAAKITKGKF